MARLKQLSFRVLRKRLRATPSIYRLFAGYSLANPNTFQWSLVAIRQMHLRETSHKNVENAHSERKYLRYSGQSVRCNIQDEANLRYIHENMKSHRYLQSTSDVFFSFHYLICILQLVQLDILTTLTFIAFERVELFHNSVSSQDLRFRYEDSEKSRSSDLVLLRTVYQPKMIMTTSGQCRFFLFLFNRIVFSYVGAKGRISGAIRVVWIIRGAASGAKTKPMPSRTRVKSERVGETVSSFSELAIFTTRSTLLFGR